MLFFRSEKNNKEYAGHKTHAKMYHPPGINQPPHVRMKFTPRQHLPPLPPLPFYIEPDSSEPEEQPNDKESLSEEGNSIVDTNLSSDSSNETTECGFDEDFRIPTNRSRWTVNLPKRFEDYKLTLFVDNWKLIYMDNWKLIFLKCIETLILGSAVGRTFNCVVSHLIYFVICCLYCIQHPSWDGCSDESWTSDLRADPGLCTSMNSLRVQPFWICALDLTDVVKDTKLCYKYLFLFKIKLNLSPHSYLTTLHQLQQSHLK